MRVLKDPATDGIAVRDIRILFVNVAVRAAFCVSCGLRGPQAAGQFENA
jgi:hypothetical protein